MATNPKALTRNTVKFKTGILRNNSSCKSFDVKKIHWSSIEVTEYLVLVNLAKPSRYNHAFKGTYYEGKKNQEDPEIQCYICKKHSMEYIQQKSVMNTVEQSHKYWRTEEKIDTLIRAKTSSKLIKMWKMLIEKLLKHFFVLFFYKELLSF